MKTFRFNADEGSGATALKRWLVTDGGTAHKGQAIPRSGLRARCTTSWRQRAAGSITPRRGSP
jgi:hypothetical protein